MTWKRGLQMLEKNQPDNEVVPFHLIVGALGLDHTLWLCRVEPQHNDVWINFIEWCAQEVQNVPVTEENYRDRSSVIYYYRAIENKLMDPSNCIQLVSKCTLNVLGLEHLQKQEKYFKKLVTNS
jgi:hypothetical protein